MLSASPMFFNVQFHETEQLQILCYENVTNSEDDKCERYINL